MNADLIHDTAMAYALDNSPEKMEAAVEAALPLTQVIAARFAGRGIEVEDLRQVAAMALVEALQRFDPKRGLRFTTFVTPTMTGKVRNYIRDKAQILRSPRGLREQGIKMDRANEELTRNLHREPSIQELANHLDWSVDQVLDVQRMRQKTTVTSLDMPSEDGTFAYDKVGADDSQFEGFEMHEDLKKAMRILNDQEKSLLKMRYRDNMTQSEIANVFGMTQMQVSRMQRRVLSSLKQEMLRY